MPSGLQDNTRTSKLNSQPERYDAMGTLLRRHANVFSRADSEKRSTALSRCWGGTGGMQEITEMKKRIKNQSLILTHATLLVHGLDHTSGRLWATSACRNRGPRRPRVSLVWPNMQMDLLNHREISKSRDMNELHDKPCFQRT